VKFTCPKCYETFSARKGKTSTKVQDAATLNEAFGHICKVSLVDLARIFLSRQTKPWTMGAFHAAIEKKTGLRYSRAHANTTLKKFKTSKPSVVTVDGVSRVAFSGPIVSVITSHPLKNNSKVLHETRIADPLPQKAALIQPVRIATKTTIP
jgi:hypothetical protein